MDEKHFTVTTYIIDNNRVLLLQHKKLGKWLPPGGHLELGETPPEGAKREVLEETGLLIDFIPQENITINRFNAASFERPYLCLLENIPAYKEIPAHQHMDLIYLAKPSGGTLFEDPALRWFTLDEVHSLISDHDIFAETKETIAHLLTNHSG